MDTGNLLISDLAETVGKSGKTAYVRATLTPTDNGWTTRYLEAVIGHCPPGWDVATWSYDAVRFVAREVPAESLAAAFTGVQPLDLGDFEAAVPDLQPQTYWQFRPSLYRLDTRRLPWPTVEWTVSAPAPNGMSQNWQPQGILVGEQAPTFTLFQVAHRAFYSGDYSSFGANQAPSDFGRAWVIQDAAWLHRVRVSPTHVDIVVRGTDAAATRIDIVGAGGVVSKQVGKTGKVRLRTSEGIADDAWLYLVDGHRCLDYRVLGNRLAARDDLLRQGVEITLPDDPEVQISSLVGQVESSSLEYKSKLPDLRPEVHKVMKTVAAFATGNGGNIVFGVDPDEITILGLEVPDAIKARDRLYQLVRDHVTPSLVVDVAQFDLDGKTLILLAVPSGPEPPYALQAQPPAFYIRRGTHTVPARADELRQAILSRLPQEPESAQRWAVAGPWSRS